MKDNKLCILIVDDEKRMAEGLADSFRAKGYMVLMAHDGEEGVETYYANNSDIDIILMDVMMPVMNGFQAVKELRGNGEEVPVIMLTAKSESYDQLEGFGVGADDYVCKPFLPSILEARIESILKRVNKNIDKDLVIGKVVISTSKGRISVDGIPLELTRREYDLLHYLVLNQGISLTREQILTGVWGYDYEGDIRTVDTHIKQLRIKLANEAHLIRTVHRVGYIMEDLNEN